MPKPTMENLQHGLELDSRLAELSRVWPWIEALADEYGVAGETRFAMQLCMEEALANVVMHGYREEPGHPIVVRASAAGEWLFIAIEDEAPPFSLEEAVPPTKEPADLEAMEPGGNGIRLLRRFAGSVAYEPLPHGNRLTIGFSLALPEAPDRALKA
jgi:serine/threonine-protein kinase RsbW